jgi:hypothetical protein
LLRSESDPFIQFFASNFLLTKTKRHVLSQLDASQRIQLHQFLSELLVSLCSPQEATQDQKYLRVISPFSSSPHTSLSTDSAESDRPDPGHALLSRHGNRSRSFSPNGLPLRPQLCLFSWLRVLHRLRYARSRPSDRRRPRHFSQASRGSHGSSATVPRQDPAGWPSRCLVLLS